MALRVVIFLAPMCLGFAASFAASRYLDHVSLGIPRIAWWLAVAVVSTGTVIWSDKAISRLLPLVSLLRLNLAFPDEAPSRFREALRRPSARDLERKVGDGYDQQSKARTLLDLVGALTAHDPKTRGHSERVRAYSALIGEEMGLSQAELERLQWGALLHDIGKLDVPHALLNKPGKPNRDEWRVLQQHPATADSHLEPLADWLGDWRFAASQHHCRYDGTGYPVQLAGEAITMPGRIVAVADAFDVMTSKRSYKDPLPAKVALEELVACSGTHFDPAVVRAFLNVGTRRLGAVTSPLSWLGIIGGLDRVGAAGFHGVETASSSVAGIAGIGNAAAAHATVAVVGLSAMVTPVTGDEVTDALAYFDPTPDVVEVATEAPTTTIGPIDTTTIAVPKAEQPPTTVTVVAPTTTTITGSTTTTEPPQSQLSNDAASLIASTTSTSDVPTTSRPQPPQRSPPTTTTLPSIAYGGTPRRATTWIPAEAFDTGGLGVSFGDDNGTRDSRSTFRIEEAVDITNKSNAFDENGDPDGYTVGWNRTDDWQHYSLVDVPEGPGTLQVRVASGVNVAPGGLAISVDGIEVGRVDALPWTGSWNQFIVYSIPVDVPASDVDVRTVRTTVTGVGHFDIDQFRFVPPGEAIEMTPATTSSDVIRLVELEDGLKGRISAIETDRCVNLYGERGAPEAYNRTVCEDVGDFRTLTPNLNDRVIAIGGTCGTTVTVYLHVANAQRDNPSMELDFCR